MQIIVDYNGSHVLQFKDALVVTPVEIKDALLDAAFGGRAIELRISLNGRVLSDNDEIGKYSCNDILRASIAGGLKGGKGGFGAMLRAKAKEKSKKVTDFGACRDLSGRRLRHVNDQILLQKWQEAKDNSKDFDIHEQTQTGLELWYLGKPNWADGSYKPSKRKAFLQPRLKSQICKDWLESCAQRRDGKPPAGAPMSWGCPRGAKCQFAHGEADLNSDAALKFKEKVKEEKKAKVEEGKSTYMRHIDEDSDIYMKDIITAGLGVAKKMKDEDSGAVPIAQIKSGDVGEIERSRNMDDLAEEGETLALVGDEREYFKPSECECPWVAILAGTMKIDRDALVEGYSAFSTLAIEECRLGKGKWYYEVEIQSKGIMQIGWADDLFQLSSDSTDGVGDDKHSFSYDGSRQLKWNGDSSPYGLKWNKGDIVGCYLEVSFGYTDISYYLNGEFLGNAFMLTRSEESESPHFYPVISLEHGEKLSMNMGNQAFKYQPDGDFVPVQSHFECSSKESYSREENLTRIEVEITGDKAGEKSSEESFNPLDIESEEYSSIDKIESLGMSHLKAELQRRGLKAGGTLSERAQRLFSVRGKAVDEIDPKIKQKQKPT